MHTSSHLRTIKQPSTIVKGVELIKENNEQQQQPTTIVNGVELVKENNEQETLCTHTKKKNFFKAFFFISPFNHIQSFKQNIYTSIHHSTKSFILFHSHTYQNSYNPKEKKRFSFQKRNFFLRTISINQKSTCAKFQNLKRHHK